MKTKVNFSKIQQCGQIWDDMSACGKGRLCSKCNETIIDFRGFTDWEIAVVHSNSEEKVCGIYDDKIFDPNWRQNETLQTNKKLILAGVFGVLASSSIYSNPISQPIGAKIVQTANLNNGANVSIQHHQNENHGLSQVDTLKWIKGKIKDDNGEPLIGGTLVIKGTANGTSTDIDGSYSLDLTNEFIDSDSIHIVVSYIGYMKKEIVIMKDQFLAQREIEYDVVLDDSETVFVTTFSVRKRKWYEKIGYSIKKLFRKKK